MIVCIFLAGLFFINPEQGFGNAGNKKIQSPKPSSCFESGKSMHLKSYRVKKHDTLYGLSRKFNVPIQRLKEINKISGNGSLKTGTILKVPVNDKLNKTDPQKHANAKETDAKGLKFIWPVNDVITYTSEGISGVKSIGITIVGKSGSKVVSSAEGIVCRIGHMRGFGNYVVITHKNRFATVYANLGSILVAEGDHIDCGATIGKMGKQNKNLHFQIDFEGRPTNPLNHLPKRT